MVLSMTGYGGSSLANENYRVSVELKSLNSKFIEVNLKLPRAYMRQEMELRNYLIKRLERGKVNVLMTVEVINPDLNKLNINKPLVMAYTRELENLRSELQIHAPLDLEYILSLPDAIQTDNSDSDPEEWMMIRQAFETATDRMIESRSKEGTATLEDLRGCRDRIKENLEEIKDLIPDRMQYIRDRIESAINDIKDRAQIDGNRYEQELIYYIEKLDINEEIVRLTKHLEYFEQTLEEKEKSNGKKLGFIAQEMGREINTIGSKANNAGIQIRVVRMKEELERIKEQVLNIV